MDILATLRLNICEVTFTKRDGSERKMICTLISDHLPFQDKITPDLSAQTDTDLVVVWDLEERGWRSFKPSRMTNITFEKE